MDLRALQAFFQNQSNNPMDKKKLYKQKPASFNGERGRGWVKF